MVEALIFDKLFMAEGVYTVSGNGDNVGRKPRYVEWVVPIDYPEYWGTGRRPTSVWVTDSNIKDAGMIAAAWADKTRVAWLLEPRELHPENYEAVIRYHDCFDYVVTHDRELYDEIPQPTRVVLAPLGGTRIHPSDWGMHTKTNHVSSVASKKLSMPGHQLRHGLYYTSSDVDWYGDIAGKHLEHKIDSLRDYRFQVVIENVQKQNWFTEALIDCFLTGTVPIYWGCTNLSSYGFVTPGYLQVRDLSDLKSKVDWAWRTGPRYYKNFSTLIRRNFEVAHRYAMPEDYLYRMHPYLFGDH